MKYLKSYKLFESVDKSGFPTYTELHDFFVELEDDEITKFNYKDDMGYLIFPMGWNRQIQSELYYDMSFEKDFVNHKSKYLEGDTWPKYFLDPVTYPNKKWIRRSAQWIHLDDVEEKRTNVKQIGGEVKTFEELLVQQIEKGNIKAYPFIYMTFDMFKEEHLDEVIERLKMVYEATDFRPLWGFWLEDYADENSFDVMTFVNSSLYLVNCKDEEYQHLAEIFNESNLDKQVTKHFI